MIPAIPNELAGTRRGKSVLEASDQLTAEVIDRYIETAGFLKVKTDGGLVVEGIGVVADPAGQFRRGNEVIVVVRVSVVMQDHEASCICDIRNCHRRPAV